MNIHPLESDRLFLRESTKEDAPFILRLLNSPGWLKQIGDRNIRSLSDAESYILNRFVSSYQANGFGLLIVELKGSKNSIGLCGLLQRSYLNYPDLGFAVMPEYEGMGYAYEASNMALSHGFNTLGLPLIYGITKDQNLRSKSLLFRLGFRFQKVIEPAAEMQQLLLFSKKNKGG